MPEEREMPEQDEATPAETTRPQRVTLSELPTFSGFPGIQMQALAGAKVMVNRVAIAPGNVVPEHQHPHEQAGYVLEGHLRLTVEGEAWELRPGDAYVLPGGTPHGAVAGPEGCVVLDVFAPPREDYLALTKS
jgi:quercetin dioxygenase-like cupin family protein